MCFAEAPDTYAPETGRESGAHAADAADSADPLAGIRALCTAVGRGCKGLLELNLSSNCLKQRSCTLLAEALERNETLSSLDLSDNEMIGDQGVLALARSVW